MRIRSLFMAMPAVALGLACSTPSSKSHTTARAEQDRSVGSAGTGMASGDMKGHASDQVIMGRLAETSGGSLVIESTGGDRHTLSLVDQTVITVDGRQGSAAELHAGQEVRASFNEQDGRQVAVKVEATPAAGGANPYAPASPPGTAPSEMPPGGTMHSPSMPSTPSTPPSSSESTTTPSTPPSSSDGTSGTSGTGGRGY